MLTNWMGYDILKEVSISDILEAKMKRTIGERLKKARKDAKIRQGAAAEKDGDVSNDFKCNRIRQKTGLG